LNFAEDEEWKPDGAKRGRKETISNEDGQGQKRKQAGTSQRKRIICPARDRIFTFDCH
jgi:hypothetical protein